MSSFAKSLVMFLAVCIPATASAQAKRAMTIVDLLEVPRLGDPQLSPDGSQLAYVLSRADWKANKRISHIWRIDSDGANAVQLTNGEDGESSPRWSPDGRSVAFLAKRGGDEHTQVYLLPNTGGEARRLTTHQSDVSSISWAPDGTAIYYIAPDPKTEEEKKKDEAKDDVVAFDEDYKQRHLWKVTLADTARTRLTQGDYSVRGYEVSRDGRYIAHHRAPTPLIDNMDEGEVWLMRADGSDAKQLTLNATTERGAELSPSGDWVLFLGDVNGDRKSVV